MTFTLGVGPATQAGSSTHVITLNSTTAGRQIVVGGTWDSSTVTISSITCSGESNLTLHGSPIVNSAVPRSAQLASLANNVNGGNKTITITMSSTVGGSFFALEFAGGDTSSLFDVAGGSTGNSTNPTTSIVTTADNDLIVSIANEVAGGSFTVGSGYTLIDVPDWNGQTIGEYKLDAGAAGSQTVDYTFASTTQWVVAAIGLKMLDPNSHVTPTAGALAFSTPSPTVDQTLNVIIQPTGGGLTLTGNVPFLGPLIEASSAELVITGYSPTVAYGGHEIFPTAGDLTFTGEVPTQSMSVVVTPAAGALILTGVATPSAVNESAPFEVMTAFGVGVSGTAGIGVPVFEWVTATGTAFNPESGVGQVEFKKLTGVGYAFGQGVVTFSKMAVTGVQQQFGAGIVEWIPMAAHNFSGFVRFEL